MSTAKHRSFAARSTRIAPRSGLSCSPECPAQPIQSPPPFRRKGFMALASPPELLAVVQPVSALCNVSGSRFETTMRRASSLGRTTGNSVTGCRPMSLCPFRRGLDIASTQSAPATPGSLVRCKIRFHRSLDGVLHTATQVLIRIALLREEPCSLKQHPCWPAYRAYLPQFLDPHPSSFPLLSFPLRRQPNLFQRSHRLRSPAHVQQALRNPSGLRVPSGSLLGLDLCQ